MPRYVAPHAKPFDVHVMKGLRDVSPPSKEIPGAVFVNNGDDGIPKSKSAQKRAKKKEKERLQKEMEKLNISNKESSNGVISHNNGSHHQVSNSVPSLEVQKSSFSYPADVFDENQMSSPPLDTSWQTVPKGKTQSAAAMKANPAINGRNVVVAPVTNNPSPAKKSGGGGNNNTTNNTA